MDRGRVGALGATAKQHSQNLTGFSEKYTRPLM